LGVAFPQIRFGSLEFELLLRLYLKAVPSPINILADRTGAPVRAVETAAEKLRKAGLVTISNGKVNRFYRRVELSTQGASAFDPILPRLSASGASIGGEPRQTVASRWIFPADQASSCSLSAQWRYWAFSGTGASP